MSNMSYCRFSNTLSDLVNCRETLEGILSTDPDVSRPSPAELDAAKQLVMECKRVVEMIEENSSSRHDMNEREFERAVGELIDGCAQELAE